MHEHHIRVARTARYAVLGPSDSTAIREVWFVLHGYGQLAADFLGRFEALDNGTRLIVAPEALSRFYLVDVSSRSAAERPVGATWMTREERAQEIGDYVGYLDAVLGEVGARFTGRAWPAVTVLGFSQGTATAARWLSSGTARPSHLVLWGGLLPPELELTEPDHPVRRATLHLIVGSRDGFVTEPRLADEEARLRAAGLSWEVVRYDGGHGLHRETLLELARRLAAMPNG